jgi:hypothetical protein
LSIKSNFRIILSMVALFVILAVIYGCSPSDQLGGVELNNALPDTRITGTPPVLRETDFIVSFSWTGVDPDGEIAGYHWKIANNGIDGLSVLDTLTIDPATGDTLNPWTFTQATDTTFIVPASYLGFENDSWLPDGDQRFYEHHSLFIVAEDEDGGLDPTPAHITFTATTLAPSIHLESPSSWYNMSTSVLSPSTVTLQWAGTDPDFELGVPVKVRYLSKRSLLENGATYCMSEHIFNQSIDYLVSFSDPGWSDWVRYGNTPEEREITIADIQEKENDDFIYYLFALQAQDTAGAVSQDRIYNSTVYNFRVDNSKSPKLTIRERYLGFKEGTGVEGSMRHDIARNQPLEYSWYADAVYYGGRVDSYRYGWDVEDPDNESDPGWAVSWGNTPLHKKAPIRAFSTGPHSLVVKVKDDSGLFTVITWYVQVVPVPDPDDQKSVLLIDDVSGDNASQAWPDSNDVPLDTDILRDEFWNGILSEQGLGFVPELDSIDTDEDGSFIYRDAVEYKVLLWTTKSGSRFISDTFAGQDKYVWLGAYQRNVGNLFMAGSESMTNFDGLELSPAAMPLIYDTSDINITCSGLDRRIGYGTRRDLDTGEDIRVGPELYPYRTNGLSVVDMISPPFVYLCASGALDRKRRCVGTRAITIDQNFADNYLGQSSFPPLININPNIIWKDSDPQEWFGQSIPFIQGEYAVGGYDEFYDTNVTSRPNNWSSQTVDIAGEEINAVEPMWRLYTRYDWIMDQHIASGDTDYPVFAPKDSCGFESFYDGEGNAYSPESGRHYTKLHQAPLGVFLWKTADTKPGGKADVLWGFDPYAFEEESIKDAVLWVLKDYYELQD